MLWNVLTSGVGKNDPSKGSLQVAHTKQFLCQVLFSALTTW